MSMDRRKMLLGASAFVGSSFATVKPSIASMMFMLRALFVGYSRWGLRAASRTILSASARRTSGTVAKSVVQTTRGANLPRRLYIPNGKTAVANGANFRPQSRTPVPNVSSVLIDAYSSHNLRNFFDNELSPTFLSGGEFIELEDEAALVSFDEFGEPVATESSFTGIFQPYDEVGRHFSTDDKIQVVMRDLDGQYDDLIALVTATPGALWNSFNLPTFRVASHFTPGRKRLFFILNEEVIGHSDQFYIG